MTYPPDACKIKHTTTADTKGSVVFMAPRSHGGRPLFSLLKGSNPTFCSTQYPLQGLFVCHLWIPQGYTVGYNTLYHSSVVLTYHVRISDAEGSVLKSRLPEVDDRLLRFVCVVHQVVVSAPAHKTFHLFPVHCLFISADESQHCGIICKPNDQVLLLTGRTVMSYQCKQ